MSFPPQEDRGLAENGSSSPQMKATKPQHPTGSLIAGKYEVIGLPHQAYPCMQLQARLHKGICII